MLFSIGIKPPVLSKALEIPAANIDTKHHEGYLLNRACLKRKTCSGLLPPTAKVCGAPW